VSPKGQSTAQLVLPYIPLGLAGATAVIEEVTGHQIGNILLAIVGATTALVMARQLLTLLDNRRLNRTLESTVAALEAREVDLARQAFHDPLTSLVNRVLFTDRLNHALERQSRDHGTLAVMLCDLDDFKGVNDSLGHLAGDEVLKQVASRLQSSVRQADTIARLGGDEFALLMDNVESPEAVMRAVERVGQMLRTPVRLAETEVKVSASVGVVLAAGPGATSEQLLRDADIALYEAKYSGKSCYRLFESSMLDGVISRLQLKNDLGALSTHLGQLTLHYQPILSARTGRMTGLEALMRWQHPSRGLLYPTSFIEYAEETGAIVSVGAAVMDMACAQAAAWRDLGISCPMISVNLSARQLHDRSVVDMVERALKKYGLPPEDLTIEITESVTMGGAEQAITRLQQLKDLGVFIAIDDFGTGWSSLSYLRRLPVDFVKFDRTFTADVATDEDAALLISLMNRLAHALGLETIAEGIETSAQLAAVRKLGCDHVQGFHLARPAPASAVTELIREHRNHERQPQLAAVFSAAES
jgi:diguanylate cyclase (GGDEF)-like protein